VNNAKGPRLPLALLPTTAGTGSEATPIAILTLPDGEKRAISSPLNLPDWTILDPNLTLGLPPAVTAMTGMDAMVHAIEAYSSLNANNNPLSRLLAQQAMALLAKNIGLATHQGHNGEARGAMLLGSFLAGQAFANSPVAAVHALAYPIGGGFGVPHGLSTALMLPHVLRFNTASAGPLYAELASFSFPELASVAAPARPGAFVERLMQLSTELGLKRRLRDVGIAESHLPQMARDAMKQTRLLVNNPRVVSEADALAMYTAAW
jgi:alcohol dehydrogenase class IV